MSKHSLLRIFKIPSLLLVALLSQAFINADELKPSLSDVKKGPVIVELFTSEGCSSCPPAERLVSKLKTEAKTKKQNIEFVVYHVDYWDYIGWTDRFASSAYSTYQKQSCRNLRSRSIYTPQMIVQGVKHFTGSDSSTAKDSIASTLNRKKTDQLTLKSNKLDKRSVTLDYDFKGKLKNTVLRVCVTESGLSSKPNRGENSGRTLKHDAVVRCHKFLELVNAKGQVRLTLPSSSNIENCRIVAYVQGKSDNQIKASFSCSFPKNK